MHPADGSGTPDAGAVCVADESGADDRAGDLQQRQREAGAMPGAGKGTFHCGRQLYTVRSAQGVLPQALYGGCRRRKRRRSDDEDRSNLRKRTDFSAFWSYGAVQGVRGTGRQGSVFSGGGYQRKRTRSAGRISAGISGGDADLRRHRSRRAERAGSGWNQTVRRCVRRCRCGSGSALKRQSGL